MALVWLKPLMMSSLGAAGVLAAGVATGVIPQEQIADWFKSNETPIVEAAQEPKQKQVASLETKSEETTKAVEPTIKPDTKDEVVAPKPSDSNAKPSVAGSNLPPRFDVMRVEKDGSVLVAGNSQPNARVELMTGQGVSLAVTNSDASGDFVLLPSNPLKPGSYSLSLKSTGPDGKTVISDESAIVNVPESGDGGVLALIEKAGEPIRIVSKPETLTEKSDKPADVAKSEEPSVSPIETKEVVEEAATSKSPEVETAKPNVSESEQTTVASVESTAEVEAPQVDQPVEKIEQKEEEPKEETVAAVSVAEETQEPAKPEMSETSEPRQEQQTIAVEAVEVEQGTVYVAGAVKSGQTVNVYINNNYLGSTIGTGNNRFLVGERYDLMPGEHKVRADVVNSNTGKVLVRAEVPLLHEPPEDKVAPAKPQVVETPSQEPELKVAAVPKSQSAVAVDNPEMPKPEESSAKPTPSQVSQTTTKQAASKPESKEVSPVSDSTEPIEKTSKPLSDTQKTDDKVRKALQPAKAVVKVNTDSPAPSPKLKVETVQRVTIDSTPNAVIRTGEAVIIKQGDSLWRISRKTYGRGIRYTTIYNANREQITNPHRIYIGQIFKIPEDGQATSTE